MLKEEYHIPVLKDEVCQLLSLKKGGIYVDCTVGGGGHSYHLLKAEPSIKLYCFDQDEEAIRYAKKRLIEFKDRVYFFNENFKNFRNRLALEKVDYVDGILMDIGVSTHQISSAKRGFSFQFDGALDMRMSKSSDKSAYNVINEYDVNDLSTIFFEYGEEKFSKRIAQNIIKYRESKTIDSTKELSDIIENSIPKNQITLINKSKARIFQAIRIEVNNELDILKQSLKDAVSCLNDKGRIAVISWHSLEDRIVKQFFTDESGLCKCPRELPVCMCDNKKRLNVITKKPVVPTDLEIKENTNARSAKLRVAERVRSQK